MPSDLDQSGARNSNSAKDCMAYIVYQKYALYSFSDFQTTLGNTN